MSQLPLNKGIIFHNYIVETGDIKTIFKIYKAGNVWIWCICLSIIECGKILYFLVCNNLAENMSKGFRAQEWE